MSAPDQPKESKERTPKVKLPEVNTALHIIKGAIVKVLHTPITTTTDASKPNEGRITVEYKDANAPSKQQLDEIEGHANEKIKQDVEILHFPMNRAAAEEKYTKNPVNETYIYDKFPVPAELTELKILEIPGWNVNCTVGPVVKRTGEVRQIKIKRINHRDKKGELEFIFELETSKPSSSKTTASSSSKTSSSTAPAASSSTPSSSLPSTSSSGFTSKNLDLDDSITVSTNLINDFFSELKTQGIEVPADKEKIIRESLSKRTEMKLTMMKNTSYGRGFNAHLSSKKN